MAAAADIHSALTFPIRGKGGLVGVLAVFRETTAPVASGLRWQPMPAICHHLGRFIERVRAETAIHDAAMELAALASTDALTGLKNRREFDRALRTIPRLPFAVLSLDVDGLKEINDSEGHAAGDALLRVVGHTLGLLVRGWDVMARIGGDEFAALLPEVGVFGAQLVAERMRVAMHSLVLPTGSGPHHRRMERRPGGRGSAVGVAACRRVALQGQACRRRPGRGIIVRGWRGRGYRRTVVLRRGQPYSRRRSALDHVPADRRASTTEP